MAELTIPQRCLARTKLEESPSQVSPPSVLQAFTIQTISGVSQEKERSNTICTDNQAGMYHVLLYICCILMNEYIHRSPQPGWELLSELSILASVLLSFMWDPLDQPSARLGVDDADWQDLE